MIIFLLIFPYFMLKCIWEIKYQTILLNFLFSKDKDLNLIVNK